LAEAIGDGKRAGRACQQAMTALLRYAGYARAFEPGWQEWVLKADRYAEPDSVDRVHADRAMARAARARGRRGEARALSARGLALARSLGDPEALMCAVCDWTV